MAYLGEKQYGSVNKFALEQQQNDIENRKVDILQQNADATRNAGLMSGDSLFNSLMSRPSIGKTGYSVAGSASGGMAPIDAPSYGRTGNSFYGSGSEPLQFARGGPVKGPKGIDKVPAMLSSGEYVLPSKTTKAVGVRKLDRLVTETNGRPPVHGGTPIKAPKRKGKKGFLLGGLASLAARGASRLLAPGVSDALMPRDLGDGTLDSPEFQKQIRDKGLQGQYADYQAGRMAPPKVDFSPNDAYAKSTLRQGVAQSSGAPTGIGQQLENKGFSMGTKGYNYAYPNGEPNPSTSLGQRYPIVPAPSTAPMPPPSGQGLRIEKPTNGYLYTPPPKPSHAELLAPTSNEVSARNWETARAALQPNTIAPATPDKYSAQSSADSGETRPVIDQNSRMGMSQYRGFVNQPSYIKDAPLPDHVISQAIAPNPDGKITSLPQFSRAIGDKLSSNQVPVPPAQEQRNPGELPVWLENLATAMDNAVFGAADKVKESWRKGTVPPPPGPTRPEYTGRLPKGATPAPASPVNPPVSATEEPLNIDPGPLISVAEAKARSDPNISSKDYDGTTIYRQDFKNPEDIAKYGKSAFSNSALGVTRNALDTMPQQVDDTVIGNKQLPPTPDATRMIQQASQEGRQAFADEQRGRIIPEALGKWAKASGFKGALPDELSDTIGVPRAGETGQQYDQRRMMQGLLESGYYPKDVRSPYGGNGQGLDKEDAQYFNDAGSAITRAMGGDGALNVEGTAAAESLLHNFSGALRGMNIHPSGAAALVSQAVNMAGFGPGIDTAILAQEKQNGTKFTDQQKVELRGQLYNAAMMDARIRLLQLLESMRQQSSMPVPPPITATR